MAKTLSFAAANAATMIASRQNCVVARISGGFDRRISTVSYFF